MKTKSFRYRIKKHHIDYKNRKKLFFGHTDMQQISVTSIQRWITANAEAESNLSNPDFLFDEIEQNRSQLLPKVESKSPTHM